MNIHRHTGLGFAIILGLAACSREASTGSRSAGDPQMSKLVAIRVVGFVEAAGIT